MFRGTTRSVSVVNKTNAVYTGGISLRKVGLFVLNWHKSIMLLVYFNMLLVLLLWKIKIRLIQAVID